MDAAEFGPLPEPVGEGEQFTSDSLQVDVLSLDLSLAVNTIPKLERSLNVNVREVGLLDRPPGCGRWGSSRSRWPRC